MSVQFSADRLSVTLRDAERTFALDASGFSLAPGQVLSLTGESGCGKTLLLELLCLIRRPDKGAVFHLITNKARIDLQQAWDAKDAATELPRLRGQLFGFVPQSGGLLPFLTAEDNIRLSQRIAGRGSGKDVTALIAKLGLSRVKNLYPDALSIGQRQRVAIARALAHRPAAVIADEPTASLDPQASRTVLGLLIGAAREYDASVVLSCHDRMLLSELGLPQQSFQVAGPDAKGRVLSRLSKPRRAA